MTFDTRTAIDRLFEVHGRAQRRSSDPEQPRQTHRARAAA